MANRIQLLCPDTSRILTGSYRTPVCRSRSAGADGPVQQARHPSQQALGEVLQQQEPAAVSPVRRGPISPAGPVRGHRHAPCLLPPCRH